MPPILPAGTAAGQPLLELRHHYHEYRDEFLQFGTAYPVSEETLLLAYRRALIAWYEMKVLRRATPPFDVGDYLRQAGEFFLLHRSVEHLGVDLPGAQSSHPLYNYLPRPVQLSDRQRVITKQIEETGQRCQDMLLLAYYHRLDDENIGEVLDIPGGVATVEEHRRNCLFLVRERLRNSGLYSLEAFPPDIEESLIDRYLRGELAGQELWDIDARRNEDVSFRMALERQEEWMEALRIMGRRQLHAIMNEEESQHYVTPAEVPVVRSNYRNYLYMMAAVIALALGLYIFYNYAPPSYERLAMAYFEPYPNVIAPTAPGADTTAGTMLERVFIPYEEQRWPEAYREFTTILPAFPAARLYLGVTALAQQDANRAMQWLEQIQPTDVYYAPAQWYLSLAYLYQNRPDAARTILLRVSETNGHPYRTQAQQLVADLS